MIASWPGVIAPNSTTDHISVFWDLFPTLVDVVGGTPPEGLDGISFLPTLKGEPPLVREYLYWEFAGYQGQQAVRKGDWKAIRKDIAKGNLSIELYNLKEDPAESTDLANDYPQIVQEMSAIMEVEHQVPEIERFKLTALGD